MKANPNTLISRFYGLHSIRKGSGKEITFVVMANVFHSELKVHEQYDLKVHMLGAMYEQFCFVTLVSSLGLLNR